MAWLALVWMLLWGSLSPLVMLSAVAVAPLCLAASRLPAVPVSRPRMGALPAAMLRFVRDLLTSSAQVAWTTLRRGRTARSAVLAIPVGPCSDTALTVVSHRLSLEPGTLVLDIDREQNILYVYVLDVDGAESVARARRSARHTADEVLHALGADRAGPGDDQDRTESP